MEIDCTGYQSIIYVTIANDTSEYAFHNPPVPDKYCAYTIAASTAYGLGAKGVLYHPFVPGSIYFLFLREINLFVGSLHVDIGTPGNEAVRKIIRDSVGNIPFLSVCVRCFDR